jgi:hypothetical protein
MWRRSPGILSPGFVAGLLWILLLPLPCRAQISKPCTVTVLVDGLDQTQTVQPLPAGCTRTWPVLHPGDSVVVQVVRAHLLHYRYEVKITEEEELEALYGVVGVGELQDAATQSFSGAVATPSTKITPLANPTVASLEQQLRQARQEISDAKAAATALINAFEKVDRQVAEPWTRHASTTTWPSEYGNAVTAFLDPNVGYEKIRADLNTAWSTAQAGQDAVFVLLALRKDEQLDRFQGQFQALIAEAQAALGALDRTAIRVRRWQGILARKPLVEQTFLVDRRSKRYTVGVFREPLSDAVKQLEPDDGIAPIQTAGTGSAAAPQKAAFASFAYEGHALHRFNVSLGAAALYRPDKKTFSIDSRIGADNAVSYYAQESVASEYGIEPVAMIGTYLRPVDNYDPDRKPAWMITVGTEISSSPGTYMLGLAWDHNPGFGVAFGLTRYEKTEPAEGWRVGQTVPTKADGTPVLQTVPTRKDDGFGVYTAFVFRPAIFSAFWKARK